MLVSTYRLQLSSDFTLHDARARVPYLEALGVSHLYLSPILAARKGSTHGYDVTDPTQVSAALGGDDAFVALANDVHARGMGIVLDIVPNHMGIGADNPFWDDLLAHGRQSRFADWFDVTWRAPTKRLEGKVLVPILGDTLENVIARNELTLERSDTGLRIRYFDHHFPINPATITPELNEKTRGDAIAELLAAQHYELAYWRVSQRDVNYRRFFDVNDLICLRVEQPAVFDATHRTVLRFVADGLVDGLRVDHVDGLLEPRRYLERLRAAVGPDVPILVEKILASDESLPRDWPVDGTTGYEFMTAMEDALIDANGYATIERAWLGRGDASAVNFASIATASKRRVLRAALNADVRRIAPLLADVARRAGWPKQRIAAYAGAIVDLTAALPVYRTYIDAEHRDASDEDRAVLQRAFAAISPNDAARALEKVLLDSWRDADDDLARARLAFVLRWQQLTGPAAAKGVEDTALYVYAPLTSRNEVGGDPGLPLAGAVDRLHARLVERAERHPKSLNATNTHDTKRSADARARIDALSEHADAWNRMLRRWRRRHRALRTSVAGRLVPTRAEENFIHQSLLGVWSGAARIEEVRERLAAYLQKAMREAKLGTSWTDPDPEYEGAITQFLGRLLDGTSPESVAYVADVEQLADTVAPHAMSNTLARLVVHLTAPGVPDIYQGDELWYAALVDPDNRRPVDWPARERVLAEQPTAEVKMRVTHRLLALRREMADVFAHGSYRPLAATGQHADRIVAFRRSSHSGEVIVVAGRTVSAVKLGWGDTAIQVPSGHKHGWRNVLDETNVASHDGRILVGNAFSDITVAVLLPVGPPE